MVQVVVGVGANFLVASHTVPSPPPGMVVLPHYWPTGATSQGHQPNEFKSQSDTQQLLVVHQKHTQLVTSLE